MKAYKLITISMSEEELKALALKIRNNEATDEERRMFFREIEQSTASLVEDLKKLAEE